MEIDNQIKSLQIDSDTPSVTADELKAECLKNKYIKLLAKPEVYPSQANWEYIITHRMDGVGKGLYRKYLVAYSLEEEKRCDYHDIALEMFPEYLKAVNHDYAVEIVYSDLESLPEAALELAIECELHDAPAIHSLLLHRKTDIAIDMMQSFQPIYTESDLYAMQQVLTDIDNLPQTGHIKSGHSVFGGGNRFICEFGHDNPADAEFCRHEDCGVDIYGVTREQRAIIDDYARRIESLQKLLSNQK